MPNLGSGDVSFHLPRTGSYSKLKTVVPTAHKGSSELPVHTGSAESVRQKTSKMRAKCYRQMALGIKPARHRAVNTLAAKTTIGLGYR